MVRPDEMEHLDFTLSSHIVTKFYVIADMFSSVKNENILA